MGCVLYLAYNRRRNIKDSMMVHMLNNSVSTLPVLLVIYGYILDSKHNKDLIKIFIF